MAPKKQRFVQRLCLGMIGVTSLSIGCNNNQLPVASVKGMVTHNGVPLAFGGIMFQPDLGPPARATIQPDGTFRLSTYGKDDGAVLGRHQVRITCYESQRPGNSVKDQGEDGPNKSHIPEKYTMYVTSGFTATVKEINEPFVFDLK
jgi:hypothetical protein